MKLLGTQKNELFEVIEESRLSPILFELVERKNPNNQVDLTSVKYKNSDFYFHIAKAGANANISCSFSPGKEKYNDWETAYNWAHVTNIFRSWLPHLEREINVEDKWSRFNEQVNNLNISFPNDSNKFSANEYQELKSKLLLLQHRLNEVELLPDQLTFMTVKIDHLTELAVQMNKFDWNGLFIGTMISIIIQLGVNQQNAAHIWQLIKQIFANYFLSN
jgi:hypothetical protein